jgi:hypothetical protein
MEKMETILLISDESDPDDSSNSRRKAEIDPLEKRTLRKKKVKVKTKLNFIIYELKIVINNSINN